MSVTENSVVDPTNSRSAAAGSPPAGRKSHSLYTAISVVSVLLVFVAWELGVGFSSISSIIIVPPTDVAQAYADLVSDGTLLHHTLVSAQQFALGYTIAAVIGVGLGLAMGTNQVVRAIFYPWVIALYATPALAIVPLLLVALGFGLIGKAVVIFLLCFFPVVLNAMAGAENLPSELRAVAQAYSATRWEFFWKVVTPGSIPYIFTGLRLAVGRGLVAVIAADLFGSDEGLGFLLLRSARLFRTADIFVVAITMAAIGVALTLLLALQERLISPWKR